VCDFSGDIDLFAKGCPVCGYSADSSATGPTAASLSKSPAHGQEARHGQEASDGLPLWVYIITAAAVVLALTLLFLRIT
jgi:hypothetical protein